MSQKWNKYWDSLEFVTVNKHFNKWKQYNKTEEKNMITKYTKLDSKTTNQLIAYSNKTWLSMSKIIRDAVKFYMNK